MMNDPIDAILATEIDAQGPGASVAIVKDGSLLYCKGHGLANTAGFKTKGGINHELTQICARLAIAR
jgi:CubicO group peptidase (beta-lactamase class C family)